MLWRFAYINNRESWLNYVAGVKAPTSHNVSPIDTMLLKNRALKNFILLVNGLVYKTRFELWSHLKNLCKLREASASFITKFSNPSRGAGSLINKRRPHLRSEGETPRAL